MTPSVVSIHYTLKNLQGELLDSSIGGQPIVYLEGVGQIIDGLEEALRGVPAGTKRVVEVPAAQAYGLRDESLIQQVPRARLPVGELNIGDLFQTGPDRHAAVVKVVAIEGENVTLDANHPLAGVDLVFEVQVLNVRAASPEEIAHGHVHGPGGHHHDH
jgi:FKBP-type peptidyl-prolyl cis-trans isomerase SlyD